MFALLKTDVGDVCNTENTIDFTGKYREVQW